MWLSAWTKKILALAQQNFKKKVAQMSPSAWASKILAQQNYQKNRPSWPRPSEIFQFADPWLKHAFSYITG
jgi:hypothetical protein